MTTKPKTTKNFVPPSKTGGYWGAVLVDIVEEHDIKPQLNYKNKFTKNLLNILKIYNIPIEIIEILETYCNIIKPEIGYTCWWSKRGNKEFNCIGVAFTYIIKNKKNKIIYESPLSKCVMKSYSYLGSSGRFHGAMFQVRGTSDEFVTHWNAYLKKYVLNNKNG